MAGELIKRLRNCAELHGECDLCLYRGNGCDAMPETPLVQAADTIEELQGWNNTLCDSVAMLMKQIAELSKPKWIHVEDHLPEEFVSVQAHMTDAGPFPSVREGYLVGGRWFFPALDEFHPVDCWRAFDEPEKEES